MFKIGQLFKNVRNGHEYRVYRVLPCSIVLEDTRTLVTYTLSTEFLQDPRLWRIIY